MTREEFERKGARGFEDIDLSFYDQIRFKQGVEARTFDEQCFYAILAEPPILGRRTGRHSKVCPSSYFASRLALSFLRKHALKSHHQGDGATVSLLCSGRQSRDVRSLQTAKRAVELDGEPVLTLSDWWVVAGYGPILAYSMTLAIRVCPTFWTVLTLARTESKIKRCPPCFDRFNFTTFLGAP